MNYLRKTIKNLHLAEKDKIESRLSEFVEIFKKGSDTDIFHELVFCLLTPQSKAKSCWNAVQTLVSNNKTLSHDAESIAKDLKSKVRFHNNKAKYVVYARNLFLKNGKIDIKSKIKSFGSISDLREWLVKNIKGMGYKEAGHFLRNIGFGKKIAILDRHILKNLKLLGVIKEIPKTLTPKVYCEIENKMEKFAQKIGIPMDHLDLLFWRKEAGEYFK